MTLLYKITIFVLFAALALPLYALSINLMIMINLFPHDSLNYDLGQDMTQKAIFVWMGSLVFGVASIFAQEKWVLFLRLIPLLTPTIFALFYVSSL